MRNNWNCISDVYYNNGNGECEIPVCSFKCDDIVVSVKSIKTKVTQIAFLEHMFISLRSDFFAHWNKNGYLTVHSYINLVDTWSNLL